MLHDKMKISRLIVHAEHVEKARSKWKSRYAKRAKSIDEGSSKNRIEIQEKPKFRKRVYNQVPFKFPKDSGDRFANLKPKKEKCTSSPTEKPTC